MIIFTLKYCFVICWLMIFLYFYIFMKLVIITYKQWWLLCIIVRFPRYILPQGSLSLCYQFLNHSSFRHARPAWQRYKIQVTVIRIHFSIRQSCKGLYATDRSWKIQCRESRSNRPVHVSSIRRRTSPLYR